MRVSALEVPTVDPFVIASGEVRATRSVLFEVELEGPRGVFAGLGEGACLPPVTKEDLPDALAEAQRLAPLLRGFRVPQPGVLPLALDAVSALPVVRAGLEVAILDAWARHDGQPLYRWLAPEVAHAALLVTDVTIPILPVARMAELAREWTARGFTSLKTKLGKSLDDDLRALAAMVEAAPAAKFRPDANAGLSVEQALRFIGEARRLGAVLECFEQPCATLAELRAVQAAEPGLTVVADESVQTLEDLEKLITARAAKGVNLKVMKSGGLLRARELGVAAQRNGLKLMVGGMVETRLGMTAATHLAASLGGVAFADLDTQWLLARECFAGGYEGRGAEYRLPDVHGLGVSRS